MSKELRDRLVNLCPPLYKAAYEKILANDLTILRLMSCRYEVLVDKIGKLAILNPNLYLKQLDLVGIIKVSL